MLEIENHGVHNLDCRNPDMFPFLKYCEFVRLSDQRLPRKHSLMHSFKNVY